MTLGSWFHQIIFSGLPRLLSGITKSLKMTFRGLADSGLSRKVIFRDLVTPEDDSPGPAQFVSRNWPGPGMSSSVIW
jgi:hypothetical protein